MPMPVIILLAFERLATSFTFAGLFGFATLK